MVAISAFSLINWGLRLGVDFTGGTILEYKIDREVSTEFFSDQIGNEGLQISSIQKTQDDTYLLKFPPLDQEDKDKVASVASVLYRDSYDELRYETVGPSIGPELIRKTMYAIVVSAGVILLWVAYQFKSVKFGASAIIAMFHDSFILVGLFSLFGRFMNVEIDFLFVTALLTTLSFSVHDTIVVFDRIREIHKKEGGEIKDISERALTETMVRSLNNSFTIIFMLTALILLGGSTVKWFAVALLVGTILGTYSSPFVAVPLLVTWDDVTKKLREKKK